MKVEEEDEEEVVEEEEEEEDGEEEEEDGEEEEEVKLTLKFELHKRTTSSSFSPAHTDENKYTIHHTNDA